MVNISSLVSRGQLSWKPHSKVGRQKSHENRKRSRSSDDLYDSINQLRKGKNFLRLEFTIFTASGDEEDVW